MTKPTVLFVAGPAPLGGSNRSLVTLLESLRGQIIRVLAAPTDGAFAELARQRELAEVYVGLPRPPGPRTRFRTPLRRLVRIRTACRVAAWAMRHRDNLSAIHANATTGLNIAALAALLTRVPLTVWVHDGVATDWGKRIGPVLRRLLPRVRWAAVSPTAADVAVATGLCRLDDVWIVPNPLDPEDVVSPTRSVRDRLVVGYLGAPTPLKGFDLLPEIVAELASLPVDWKLFTNRNPSEFNRPHWARLDLMQHVEVVGNEPDVRRAYERCDMVLVTSRHESFSRVTAEAMLNGIPVVASDLPPIREMLGTGAGLVFPVGDARAAARALRRIASSADLRTSMAVEGRRRGRDYSPAAVAERLLSMYGVS